MSRHPQPSETMILAVLDTVMDPELGRSLVAAGMIRDIVISDGHVALTLELTTPACPLRTVLRDAVEDAVRTVPGVESITVNVTARVRGAHAATELLPNVRNIIAVASGKGGVGKSTVAANLAVALAQTGAATGLLDLDIYGPSVPLLFNVHEHPEMDPERQKLFPLQRYGVALMSIGLLLDDNQPVIWRGPMVAGAVQQFLRDVEWGCLDYLVIDLPPGTGDAQLSLAQLVPLTGVVVVATAQDAALTIATKALGMFRTLQVPVLGLVENMSSFVCPHCGTETPIFGTPGTVETAARAQHAPFLGRIPLDAGVVLDGDRGVPTVTGRPDSVPATAFRALAGTVAAQVSMAALLTRRDTHDKA